MLFPKQAKNNDDVYGQQQRYAGNFQSKLPIRIQNTINEVAIISLSKS